ITRAKIQFITSFWASGNQRPGATLTKSHACGRCRKSLPLNKTAFSGSTGAELMFMAIIQSTSCNLLVMAVAGGIGSGCSFVRNGLEQCLKKYHYSVELLDATVFIEAWAKFNELKIEGQLPAEQGQEALQGKAARVRNLQIQGNRLRA